MKIYTYVFSEYQSSIHRETVNVDLTSLDSIPVGLQIYRAIKFVLKPSLRAVIHSYKDIIQGPLGGMLPWNQMNKRQLQKAHYIQDTHVYDCAFKSNCLEIDSKLRNTQYYGALAIRSKCYQESWGEQ